MKRWEEKWKKYKKNYYACLRKKGLLYFSMLVWIALRCFFRRFFTGLPWLKRRRAVAALCMAVIVSVLLFQASHSLTKTEGNHLTLQIQQKTEETEEGYEEDICHGIVLLNDGENELTGVELYLDGDPGFSLDPADEKISENTLAPGEKWNAVLKMKPGKKAGKYYVTVVAYAAELQETVEQTIRFVVREAAAPEVTAVPKTTETPETTETPKPAGTPEVTETPEDAGTPEPVETPETTETPGDAGTPEPVETPVATETSEATETPETTGTLEPSETLEATETSEPPGTSELVEASDPTDMPVTPKPMETPKPSEKSESSDSPEATGTVPPEVPPIPQPSAKTETGMENSDAQSGVPAAENDEIIRVTLPGHVSMKMNPFASDKNSQITSGQFPITNESGFPLDVEVTKAVVDVRQNAGFTRKDCSLGIDFLRNDAVVLAVRNLREGVNQIHTSFLLPSDDTAYFRIFGSVDEGTESLWEDGDLQASIVFRFSAGDDS